MTDRQYWNTPHSGYGLIETVIDQFSAWSGKPSGIYTSPGFARLIRWNSVLFKSSNFARKLAAKPLWVAKYNDFIMQPDLFGLWTDWVWWQYQEGPDLNYYNGGEAKLTELLDGYVYTPPPPSEDKFSGIVVANRGVNVRTGAGTSFNKVTTLKKYTEVIGTELNTISPSEEWLKIYYPVNGWVATKYNNQELVVVEVL